MSKQDKYNDLMQTIKADEEKEKEVVRFDTTLEQLKEVNVLMKKTIGVINEAKESNITISKGLHAANASAENAISGICTAIVKAENTPIKAKLDDESLRQLNELHDNWLEKEKLMLEEHLKQQEKLWQEKSSRFADIVRNNEGVWLSQRLFYVIGSLSLLSIITIILEIAFYMYFHWCI
jgi:hypothetical protein